MTEFETPTDPAPVDNTPAPENPSVPEPAAAEPAPVVDPARSAAGRLGAERQKQLIQYGKQYELDHHLTPGRQRLRQLVQLGRRYELEHGLRTARPRRKRRGDAWTEFLTALARVVKPVHRPAVEALVKALSAPKSAPEGDKAAA
jgi:hypothetical protein